MHILPQQLYAPLALVDSGSLTLVVMIVCTSFALACTAMVGTRRAGRLRARRARVCRNDKRRGFRARRLCLHGLARFAVFVTIVSCAAFASSSKKNVPDKSDSALTDAGVQHEAEKVRGFESTIKYIPFVKGSEAELEETSYSETDSSVMGTRSYSTWEPKALTNIGTERVPSDNRVEPLQNAEGTSSSGESDVVKSRAYQPNVRPSVPSTGYPRVGSVQPASFDEIRREINSEGQHIVQPGGSGSSVQGPSLPSFDTVFIPNMSSSSDSPNPSDDSLFLEKVNEELYACFSKVRDSVLRISVVKPVAPGSEKRVDESGSGVIVLFRGKAYLLTNYHIIDGAKSKDNVRIDLPDGSQISPENIFSCPDYDLAALEIEIYDLLQQQVVKPCVIGDCNELREGQFIMALGNPCLLRNSVTFGVIGGLRRDYNDLKNLGIDSTNRLAEFVQVSAMINPGNSGGPIYNVRGQVVGIATATLVTNVPTGIGFAVPISDALMVMKSTIDKGAWLPSKFGVNLAPLSYAELKKLGLKRPCGARILEVQKGQPAELSGVKPGDVVLSLNGLEIESDLHFARLVALSDSGATARMEIMRDNKLYEIETRFSSGNGLGNAGGDVRSELNYRR